MRGTSDCCGVNISTERNRVAFAFNGPWTPPDWAVINVRAKKLARQHALEFPAFAQTLQRSHQQQQRH
jgi:hypothetical protein